MMQFELFFFDSNLFIWYPCEKHMLEILSAFPRVINARLFAETESCTDAHDIIDASYANLPFTLRVTFSGRQCCTPCGGHAPQQC